MQASPGFSNSQCLFTIPRRSRPSLVTMNFCCLLFNFLLFESRHHLQCGNRAFVALVAQAATAALLCL